MAHQTHTTKHDNTVIGFLMAAMLLLCVFTSVILIGIF